jgi:catalase (peroxidase I)
VQVLFRLKEGLAALVAALIADGFRNYLRAGHRKPAEKLLVERANMLTLTAPEMTVLVGGMRPLNANFAALIRRRSARPFGLTST